MQKFLSLILVVCFFSAEAQDIDVLHYRFTLQLSDQNDSIRGSARMHFIYKRQAPILELDLTSINARGTKGMLVTGIDLTTKNKMNASYKQYEGKLVIESPGLKLGDTGWLQIDYRGISEDGLIISKNKYGDRTFFADNWPNRAHHWIPCVDRPDDKASVEFIVTAPDHYRVVSNGIMVSEKPAGIGMMKTHWMENNPIPTKVMVIGVARFEVLTYSSQPDTIPVSAWIYPQDAKKGFYDYNLAVEILSFFQKYIGPFPYKKLANVQSKTIFGGMENASAIFYAENSVTGDRREEDLMAHEIAHQWFGDAASEKSFTHVWLSEGFATYFTNLYWEKKYGKEAMANRLKEDREQVIEFAKTWLRPVVDSSKDLMSLLNANSYQKGSWVLHMLRNEVGDTVFQKIIRTYYNQYKNGNADSRDFEAVAEKVSGKELTPFFNQWLYQPGVPQLKVEWKRVNDKTLSITVRQTGKQVYRFPLAVGAVGSGKTGLIKVLPITTASETFTWALSEEPKNLVLDPETALLFEGTITEVK